MTIIIACERAMANPIYAQPMQFCLTSRYTFSSNAAGVQHGACPLWPRQPEVDKHSHQDQHPAIEFGHFSRNIQRCI